MEIPKAYTFDDVLLIPQKSNVLPSYCDTSTQLSNNINLKIPVISAAMDTVSESKLAIAIAQLGGAACLHKNLSIDSQVKEVLKVPILIGLNWFFTFSKFDLVLSSTIMIVSISILTMYFKMFF